MRKILALLVLMCAACGAGPKVPHSFAPSEVTELATLPPGYDAGESLSTSCSKASMREFQDEALGNVDCSFARLSRVLPARAGERGARFIVNKRCRGRGGAGARLACSATLARPTSQVGLTTAARSAVGAAPSAAQVEDLDEPRPQDAGDIRVSFARTTLSSTTLVPRTYDRVAETHFPSVGLRELGQVSAQCEAGCDDRALRYALRVAAGHVGAGEVTTVKCFREGEGTRCVATALEPWSS